MTTDELRTFVAIASNELLRHIVASDSKKWNAYRFYAKRELAARDNRATFG